MKHAKNIAIFLLCNVVGFLAISICYYSSVSLGLISYDTMLQNKPVFESRFLAGTMIVYAISALFSISAFFMPQGPAKYVLFTAPAFVPIGYGFSALLIFVDV